MGVVLRIMGHGIQMYQLVEVDVNCPNTLSHKPCVNAGKV